MHYSVATGAKGSCP